MSQTRSRNTWQNILRYDPKNANRTTVKQYYAKWRAEHGIPDRCDNNECVFHAGPLTWMGKPLPLILDHVDGNSRDNRPEKLRYLCPNCDSQLFTRGGRNKGRVEQTLKDRFTLLERDGSRRHEVFFHEEQIVSDFGQVIPSKKED